jgi:hypothetical protein
MENAPVAFVVAVAVPGDAPTLTPASGFVPSVTVPETSF